MAEHVGGPTGGRAGLTRASRRVFTNGRTRRTHGQDVAAPRAATDPLVFHLTSQQGFSGNLPRDVED